MTRNRWAVARAVTFLFSVIYGAGAFASEFTLDDSRSVFRISAGILNGESGEYVYDATGAYTGIPGYKISELQWELKDVAMLGLGFTFPLNEHVKLNIDYWRNAVDG
ncbi:MAG TPA: omptin family outer membrane protease, partial [Gammaproteobacteria bacterium]